jgi:hypothetical protein
MLTIKKFVHALELIARTAKTDPRGLNDQNAQVAIAALQYLAKDGAIAGRDLLGDAAKSRPLENASPMPIAATIALEMIGAIPRHRGSRSSVPSNTGTRTSPA